MKSKDVIKTVYMCDFCEKEFEDKKQAEEHEKIHDAELMFAKNHKAKVAIGDLVRYDGMIYKVNDVAVRTNEHTGVQFYLYAISKACGYESDEKQMTLHIYDYCDENRLSEHIEFIMSRKDAEDFYGELEALSLEKHKISLNEFINAVNAY